MPSPVHGNESMKTAFAYWDNRIAPVFDTARHLHLVDSKPGKIVSEKQELSSDSLPTQKARNLVDLGIETLVCGAISKPMLMLIRSYGIRVHPFIAGDLQEVVQAWLSGRIGSDAFAMPGCCRRRRHTDRCTKQFSKKGEKHGNDNQTPSDR
jgi:predicted Fe-Mo cluster-binding NifX family protein